MFAAPVVEIGNGNLVGEHTRGYFLREEMGVFIFEVDIWDLLGEFRQYDNLDKVKIWLGDRRVVLRFGNIQARTDASNE